ncbi:MAG: methyl-accepting chemotaxis protein, partial [Planctomycetota bacterium]
MARGRKLFHTLLGRSILLGVLPAAIVILAIVIVNSFRAIGGFTRNLEQDLRTATELVANELKLANERNIAFAAGIARAQEAGQFGRRVETLRLLEQTLRGNPSVYAACVAYEPDADGNDAAGAGAGVPAEALGAGGRFYPYFKRDPKAPGGVGLEPLQSVAEDGGLWYDLPKQRFERAGVRDAVITKPYEYLGEDIIENVVPIVVDGRFVGIAGVDVSLASMQARVDGIARTLDADIFVETRGFIVAASTDAMSGTSLQRSAIERWPLAPLLELAPKVGAELAMRADPETGADCYFVAATVPTGQWRVLVRKRSDAVLAEIGSVIALNLATALAGAAVVVALLSAGSIAIARRVRIADSIAARIAEGDLSSRVPEVRGSDETATLVRTMARMNDDLGAIVGAVRAASARLGAASAQLAATSREQDASARTLSGSSGQIAAAVREIAATGAELLRTIEAVDQSSRRTADSAVRGRRELEAVAESVGRLDHATGEIAGRLETISEKAEAISGVVDSITKVAEQTNLLSVNAAIEA